MSDLALHFLSKMKIMVVKDIEREDIEFVCKVSDGCMLYSLLNQDLPNMICHSQTFVRPR